MQQINIQPEFCCKIILPEPDIGKQNGDIGPLYSAVTNLITALQYLFKYPAMVYLVLVQVLDIGFCQIYQEPGNFFTSIF